MRPVSFPVLSLVVVDVSILRKELVFGDFPREIPVPQSRIRLLRRVPHVLDLVALLTGLQFKKCPFAIQWATLYKICVRCGAPLTALLRLLWRRFAGRRR